MSTVSLLQAVVPMADPAPADSDVKPGWIALIVVLLLVLVTVLLWLNMRKQLGKIDIPDDETRGGDAEPEEPAVDGEQADDPARDGQPGSGRRDP